jgi:hypothetical protein
MARSGRHTDKKFQANFINQIGFMIAAILTSICQMWLQEILTIVAFRDSINS